MKDSTLLSPLLLWSDSGTEAKRPNIGQDVCIALYHSGSPAGLGAVGRKGV